MSDAVTEWNPDNEDTPDSAEDQDDSNRDGWAEYAAYARTRYRASRKVIAAGGSPWQNANDSDRATALSVLAFYAEHPDATTGRVCASLWIRPHELYSARWLLVSAGMLRQTRGQYRVVEGGLKAP